MSNKYHEYMDLLHRETLSSTQSMENWLKYLDGAARNFKYSFSEQILINSQKPGATAVADYDTWKNRFGRVVKTGTAMYLPVIENGKPMVKNFFDITDTIQKQTSTPVPQWGISEQNQQAVIEYLTAQYSLAEPDKLLDVGSDLENVLSGIYGNMASDYLQNNIETINTALSDGRLHNPNPDIDDKYVQEQAFETVLYASVAFIVNRRLGIGSESDINEETLESLISPYLSHFNTEQSINALGNAVSHISEECLRNVETAVKSFDKEQLKQQQIQKESEFNEPGVHSGSNERNSLLRAADGARNGNPHREDEVWRHDIQQVGVSGQRGDLVHNGADGQERPGQQNAVPQHSDVGTSETIETAERGEVDLGAFSMQRIPPMFVVDWEEAKYDFNLNLYDSGDMVAYDKDGVSYRVSKMGDLNFISSTTSITPLGDILGDKSIPSYIRYDMRSYRNGDITAEQVRSETLHRLEAYKNGVLAVANTDVSESEKPITQPTSEQTHSETSLNDPPGSNLGYILDYTYLPDPDRFVVKNLYDYDPNSDDFAPTVALSYPDGTVTVHEDNCPNGSMPTLVLEGIKSYTSDNFTRYKELVEKRMDDFVHSVEAINNNSFTQEKINLYPAGEQVSLDEIEQLPLSTKYPKSISHSPLLMGWYDALEQDEELTLNLAHGFNKMQPINGKTLEQNFEKMSAPILQQSRLTDEAYEVVKKHMDIAVFHKQISLSFGHLENGTTVWDRLNDNPETNDYVSIAHVSEEGDITWHVDDDYFGVYGDGRFKNLLKAQLQDYANSVKNKPFLETAKNNHYDLSYAHLGNGLSVANRLEDDGDGDYAKVAHIDYDRSITWYSDNLPEDVKVQIQQVAVSDSKYFISLDIYHERNKWLAMFSDIVRDNGFITKEDLEYTPFDRHGGLGKFVQLFGIDDYERVLNRINKEALPQSADEIHEIFKKQYPDRVIAVSLPAGFTDVRNIPADTGLSTTVKEGTFSRRVAISEYKDLLHHLRDKGVELVAVYPESGDIFVHTPKNAMSREVEQTLTPAENQQNNEPEYTPKIASNIDALYAYVNTLGLDNRAKNRMITDIRRKIGDALMEKPGLRRAATVTEAIEADSWLQERHPILYKMLANSLLAAKTAEIADSIENEPVLENSVNPDQSQTTQSLADNEHIENIDGVDFVIKTVRNGQPPNPSLEASEQTLTPVADESGYVVGQRVSLDLRRLLNSQELSAAKSGVPLFGDFTITAINGDIIRVTNDNGENGSHQSSMTWSLPSAEVWENTMQPNAQEAQGNISRDRTLWDEYKATKRANSNKILFQSNLTYHYYEAMGDDALTIADAIGLPIVMRDVGDGESVPIIGTDYLDLDKYAQLLYIHHSDTKDFGIITRNSQGQLNSISRKSEFAIKYHARQTMLLDYQRIKEQYPNNVILYKYGNNFEIIGNDAMPVGDALDIYRANHEIGLAKRIPLASFPADISQQKLDEYVQTLAKAGFGVAIRHESDKIEIHSLEDAETLSLMGNKLDGVAEDIRRNAAAPSGLFAKLPDRNINADVAGKYSNTHFRIRKNGYDSSGRTEWEANTRIAYENEVSEILEANGWDVHKSLRSGVSSTASKGRNHLYLHPQDFSGVVENSEREVLFEAFKNADTFLCETVDVYREIFDMTDEELTENLNNAREAIESELLEAFTTKRSNLYFSEVGPFGLDGKIGKKYSVERLAIEGKRSHHGVDRRIDGICATFAGEVFQSLVDSGKIVTSQTKNGIGYRSANKKELEKLQVSLAETTHDGDKVVTGIPLTKGMISNFSAGSRLLYAIDKDGAVCISDGNFVAKTNETDINVISSLINGRRKKNKVEPVINEQILEYLEKAQGSFRLSKQPHEMARDNGISLVYADEKQYFLYDQKYVDIFQLNGVSGGLEMYVNDNTSDSLREHSMIVKNQEGTVLGVLMPLMLDEQLYEQLADVLPLEVPYRSRLERIKENPTNDPYIGREFFDGTTTHIVASLINWRGEEVYEIPELSNGKLSRHASMIKPVDMESRIELWESNRLFSENQQADNEAKAAKEAAARVIYENTHGFADNQSPMQKARTLDALNNIYSTKEYGRLTMKDFIEAALKDGKSVEAVPMLKKKYHNGDYGLHDYLSEHVHNNYENTQVRKAFVGARSSPDNTTEYAVFLKDKHPYLYYLTFNDQSVLPNSYFNTEYRLLLDDNSFFTINKTAHDYGKYLVENAILAKSVPEQEQTAPETIRDDEIVILQPEPQDYDKIQEILTANAPDVPAPAIIDAWSIFLARTRAEITDYTEPFVVINWSDSPSFEDLERLTFTEADQKFKVVEAKERAETLERFGKLPYGYNKTAGAILYKENPADTELSTYEFRYDIGDYDSEQSGLYNHVKNFWTHIQNGINNGDKSIIDIGYTQEGADNAFRMLDILRPAESEIDLTPAEPENAQTTELDPKNTLREKIAEMKQRLSQEFPGKEQPALQFLDRYLLTVMANSENKAFTDLSIKGYMEQVPIAKSNYGTYERVNSALFFDRLDAISNEIDPIAKEIKAQPELQPLQPEPQAEQVPAIPYAVGDTVYLENDRRFIIDEISEFAGRTDVKLLDPNLYIPIFRSMELEYFEQEYYRNPLNNAEPPLVEAPAAVEPPSMPEQAQETQPQYEVATLARVEQISSNPNRVELLGKNESGIAYGIKDISTGSYLKEDDGRYIVFDTAEQAAEFAEVLNSETETEALIFGTLQGKPLTQIADFVKSKLETNEKFTSTELFAEATKAYGDTMANNAFTPKDAYDAMELGVNQYMLFMDNISAENVLKTLDLLPTQTRRTADMEKYQQFSTPPSIAYLANWAANVNAGDIVLEPSAGIGGIAVFAKKDGATVYVNELDKRRLEILKNLPFDGFFNEDAEQINNIHGDKIEPTVVVMNPPFTSSAERNILNSKIGSKHIEEALKILAPNGRLVAVVGQGMADDAPAFRNWWRDIKQQYNVKANIGVNGKNYYKYGTTFGIQMLVIDKTGPTIEPVKTAFVENVLDLQNILGGIRNDRPSIQPSIKLENDSGDERNPATATHLETAAEREPERKPSDPVSDTSGRTDTAVVGDRREQTDTSKSDADVRGITDNAPDLTSISDNGLAYNINRGRHRGNDGRNDRDNGTGRAGVTDSGQSAGSVEPLADRSDRPSINSAKPVEPKETVKPIGAVEPAKPTKPTKRELTDSIFEQYEPQPLLLENVQPHPANISESAAMSAIQPPQVTYKPNLSQDIVAKGILSDVQLEAVTYAGQSHSQTLPNGNTRGFFLGDGTGVGKGRTVTGIILDNYLQGSKKAVWLSENTGLVPDAKRDVKALFGNSDLVTEFKGGKSADKSLSRDEGILFATYSSLSKGFDQSGSNFEKIVNWLGKDFDGVIVFDEAHNMANSIATKGNRGVRKASQRGMAGLAIQEALPKAKIVYSSATGATEVENLRYAERLGLWGEGTAFPNGDDFVHKIKAGGLAAMELIARDMKATGVYLSRNISYEDVVYDKIVHNLTQEQRTIYDELARSWQIVLQNVNKALETTNQDLDGMAKGKAYSAFWGAQQRFFNQILTAMQIPSMITDIQKQLDDSNSIVVQLVSTNESAQEREFARLQEQELDLEDFDLTPKQMLMSYIENSFPTVQFEEYQDDNGNIKSKPVYDSEGNAVINREAARQKEELLDKLGSIKVPSSALDMIINHFGSDMVAENTGRKRRVVVKDGKAKEENIANKKEADVSAFQNGDKRIIVFSKAGGTGKSYHSDKAAKNQQHRVHYLLQAGWQANVAVQGFGRSHRSNQVSSPTFALVTTDLKGQMRFISTIAKRLDQLGALTKGQRQTGSQGLFTAGDNLENAFAADVLAGFYKALALNRVDGVSDGISVIEKLGLKNKLIDEYGHFITTAPELREVNKFLNRILTLECHEQNAVFDGYAERLHIATEKAMQEGTLDKGLENYKADKIILKEATDIRVDENTGATTKYYNLTAYNKIIPLRFNEINTQNFAFIGFYQSKNTGAVRAVFQTSSMTDEKGNVTENCRLTGQDGNEYMQKNRLENNWVELTFDKAKELWNKAIAELPEFRTSNLHLIGGTVLPVWDKLPTENVRIYRVLTSDGDMLIGRVIPENLIDATLRRLDAERTKDSIDTKDLIKGIKSGDTVHLDNNWRIVQRRVSNEQRVEVIGADYRHTDLLAKKGVFTERISYQTRYFIPAETDTAKILDEVLKISPVSRVENEKERITAKPNPSVINSVHDEVSSKAYQHEPPRLPNPSVDTLDAEHDEPEEHETARETIQIDGFYFEKLPADIFASIADNFGLEGTDDNDIEAYEVEADGGKDTDVNVHAYKPIGIAQRRVYPFTPQDNPHRNSVHIPGNHTDFQANKTSSQQLKQAESTPVKPKKIYAAR